MLIRRKLWISVSKHDTFLHDQEEKDNQSLCNDTIGADEDGDEDEANLAIHNDNLPEEEVLAIPSVEESEFLSRFNIVQIFSESRKNDQSEQGNSEPPYYNTWQGNEVGEQSMLSVPASNLHIVHHSLLLINVDAFKVVEHELDNARVDKEQSDD